MTTQKRTYARLQIRICWGCQRPTSAHFAAIGHPLAGDPRYGGGERHGLRRQFLHSHRLQLTHPRSGERMEFDSELPADLAQALALARSRA